VRYSILEISLLMRYNNLMQKRKKVKAKKILLYLFIIAVLVLAVIIYVYPMVTGALTQTSIVEYGNLQVTADATCYFIRSETVVTATSSGNIQYYFEEGQLVRKGTKVVDIVPSGGSYVAAGNSVISYYIDGFEGMFSPENITSLKRDKVESLEIQVNNTRRDYAVSGEPVYKEMDNGAWYVALWAEPEDVIKYKKGGAVYLNLPLGQVKGTTYDIIDAGDSWLVLLQFNRYYEDLPKLRKLDAEIITSDYEGLIIANKSITTMDGKPGVYVKDISGEFIFTPVSVIASDGEYSLVESSFYYEKSGEETVKVKTVNPYDEILNHPEKK
jgi:putative membrane fusion protein